MNCAECNRKLAGKFPRGVYRCRDCDPDGFWLSDEVGPRYSGDASKPFWDLVHELDGDEHEAAYVMGCMLQDLESRVLRYLNEKRGS